jgi:cephalosporin hydroxylase
MDINLFYEKAKNNQSDINEHVETLYNYALQSKSVLELGVSEGNSSWGLLKGLCDNTSNDKVFIQCDIREFCDNVENVSKIANENHITHKYYSMSDLDLDLNGITFDLTFIDTWHVYGQLKRELEKFSPITNKYIIMHDTEIDGIVGESVRCNWDLKEYANKFGWTEEEVGGGLLQAVNEFIETHPEWKMIYQVRNNNGLTIFERV